MTMHLHAQQNTEACDVVTSSKLRLANLSGVRDKSEIMLRARSSAQGLHAKCRRGILLCHGWDRTNCSSETTGEKVQLPPRSIAVFGGNLSQFDMKIIAIYLLDLMQSKI